MVLEGTREREDTTLALEAQEEFWRPTFSSPLKVDERPVLKVLENWSIVEPVAKEEVVKALHDSEDSAPGPDGITLGAMKLVSPQILAAF